MITVTSGNKRRERLLACSSFSKNMIQITVFVMSMSHLSHSVGQDVDNFFMGRGHHALTVDLDNAVTHSDPAPLSDAPTHKAADLSEEQTLTRQITFHSSNLANLTSHKNSAEPQCYRQCHSGRWSPAGSGGQAVWWAQWSPGDIWQCLAWSETGSSDPV